MRVATRAVIALPVTGVIILVAGGCGTTSLNDNGHAKSKKASGSRALPTHIRRHADDPLTLIVAGNETAHQQVCGSSKRFVKVPGPGQALATGKLRDMTSVTPTVKGGPRIRLKFKLCDSSGQWTDAGSDHAKVLGDGSYAQKLALTKSGHYTVRASYTASAASTLTSAKAYVEVP